MHYSLQQFFIQSLLLGVVFALTSVTTVKNYGGIRDISAFDIWTMKKWRNFNGIRCSKEIDSQTAYDRTTTVRYGVLA